MCGSWSTCVESPVGEDACEMVGRQLRALDRRSDETLKLHAVLSKEDEIQKLLDLKVSKASIAKITGVDRSTLYHFMRSRHLMPRGQ